MSEPIGPQYGLNPRIDRTEEQQQFYSRDVLTNPVAYDHAGATEFGGVSGLVQPTPHVPTASERLMQIHHLDPQDPGEGGPGSVPAPEFEGSFNSEY